MIKKIIETRIAFAFVYLTAFMALGLAVLSAQFHLFTPGINFTTITASIMFFDKFIIELIVILLATSWLINGKPFFKRLGYFLVCTFIALVIIQITFIQRTGDFASRLALSNINHISFVINLPNITAVFVFIILCALFPLLAETTFSKTTSVRTLTKISFWLLFSGALLWLDALWLPDPILLQRTDYFRIHNMEHTSPLIALYDRLIRKIPLDSTLTPGEIERLKKLGFSYNAASDYPLIKSSKVENKIPFKSKTENPRQPNMIIFFIEGLSARTLSVYGAAFKDLTPNLSDFSRVSMAIQNYFNHTAATYPALQGQLCSLYPFREGGMGWSLDDRQRSKKNYFCLTDVLKNQGYETIFIDAHLKDAAYVDDMLWQLGFDKVWTAEALLREFLGNAKPLGKDPTVPTQMKESLSDNQLCDALIAFLKKREKDHEKNPPFFVGLYNLGTHAWVDVGVDGEKYGDGKNRILNTIHNLDAAFGKFWRYYQNSSYQKDTIIIFTSDHAHFQEESYASILIRSGQTGYQRLFVDRIPFIIHDPTRDLPPTFNANNATSLDFTPSLVHYLGFETQEDPFLGTSIFSRKQTDNPHLGFASIVSENFVIDGKKIHTLNNSKEHREDLLLMGKFITACQNLERKNRIWKK
ncbi:MAG TPA: sulfatase-like hydrolase/transferase [Candidatus Omnitrophota bacterium]|nr:sulfatase-like hydrolase/transferase [Candidatus Omnitrophota bacterium]